MSARDTWWLLGAICIIAGITSLLNGETIIAIELIGFGLVLIATGDEELRESLKNLFLSIYRGILRRFFRS